MNSRIAATARSATGMLCLLVATAGAGEWAPIDDERCGSRSEHFLFYSSSLKKVVLIGGRVVGDTPYVMAFDPATRTWNALSDARPQLGKREAVSSLDAGACDPEGRRFFVLVARRLLSFDVEQLAWTDHGEEALLDELAARTMAYDPLHDELLVVGAEVQLHKVGWLGALAHDLAERKWRRLTFGDEATRKAHGERVAALQALADLAGRIRHAWFRDPAGRGAKAEREDLAERCAGLKGMRGPGELQGGVSQVATLIEQEKLLEALKAGRALRRRLEQLTEAESPVPPTRRNSPLVCDPVNEVMVLFGGDHEDYTTNDTWLLDLKQRSWRRVGPGLSPSPRAGHSLLYLPKSRKVVLWDGYRQDSSSDYRAFQAIYPPTRQLWAYDVAAGRWDLLAHWPSSDKALPRRAGARHMGFVGYTCNYCSTAIAADDSDNLLVVGMGSKLHSQEGRRKTYRNATWLLGVDATRVDAPGATKLGVAANSRRERTGIFRASFCEDPAPAAPPGLDALKPNRWAKLPRPPRWPFSAYRRCPYGTAAWAPDTDELLFWGGGHCSSSTSVVTHWSPGSNRMAVGYDLDEPYGTNGGGPWPYSLMGRPWVGTHAYHAYAYDVRCKLLVTSTGWLYDPARMDWLKGRCTQPFNGHCYTAYLYTTPHGVVAWAGESGSYVGGRQRGLWLFDRKEGWKELVSLGKMPITTVVDTSGACYDSKRDRLLMMTGAGYNKPCDGTLVSYSFATGKIEKIVPTDLELGAFKSFRESTYIPGADWVLVYERLEKDGASCHPVLDCAQHRWMLVDLGPAPAIPTPRHLGMAYDASRGLIYAWACDGDLWALKLDPKTVKIVTGNAGR